LTCCAATAAATAVLCWTKRNATTSELAVG
jgi:hypothetical protein